MKAEDNAVIFSDRFSAGRDLARQLIQYKKYKPVILALSRGGVPVFFVLNLSAGFFDIFQNLLVSS